MQHRESTNAKIISRGLVTLLILVSWIGLPLFLKLLILGYSIFKFTKLASGGFSCTHCWKGWFITIPAVLFAFVQLPVPLYIFALLYIWYDVILPSPKKKRYASRY